MTVCLTAVWNGNVVDRRGGTQYGREKYPENSAEEGEFGVKT